MALDNCDITTGLPNSYYRDTGRPAKQPAIVKTVELAANDIPTQGNDSDHETKHFTSSGRPTSVEYWRNSLAGGECSPYPTLPPFVDRPDAEKETEYQFPRLLELFGDISISTLVRAAWALITSSMTDSDDVVFGATTAEGDATVPVRMKLNGNQKALEYLKEAQRQADEMIPYMLVGLDQIAGASTDCQKACTFQTVLLLSQDESLLKQFSKYGLTIQIQISGDQINTKALFDARVIEPLLAFKLLRRLEFVMQQLNSAAPEMTLNEVQTLPPQELDQIIEWNSGVPPVVERCIHDIVQERVQADPEAQAVCAWDGELTYWELNDLSSCLASHLVNLGVGPEKVVPLCFEKSKWTVVAMLSVLKAGGTFVLLDPGLPEGRIQSITQKVGAETAITSTSCQTRLASFVRQTFVLSNEAMGSLKSQTQRLSSQTSKALPSNAAYIIFTSGSTGEPKGCVVEHRSYCSAAFGHGQILGMSKDIRALQFGSYNFAGAIMEMVMTLIYGGCICIPSEEGRSVNLAQTIGKLNANWAFLTATVLALLHPQDVPSLRTICVGGEPIRSSQIREWAPNVQLRQTYGSAETAAVVSSAGLDPSSVVTSVGKATTCRCWLTSPMDINQLVPIGAPGEVIFEGPVIGRHYIGNPQKTAEAFVDAPPWRIAFGPVASSSRFYRTGDLASYRSDGSIELLGRKDTQVKLRGQRIELGEIEHQARQSSPDLKEVAVELTVLGGSGPKLIAFLVPKSSQASAIDDSIVHDEQTKSIIQSVKSRLENVLPHYMVPSVLLPIPRLPLTASGKTDRRILRQMGSALTAQQILDLQPKSAEGKREPGTQLQKQLQEIWSEVLRVDASTIGLDDSFFQIGGDSVSAMRVVSEANRLGMNMKVADIFRQDTLVELAQQQAQKVALAPLQLDESILVEPSMRARLFEELESNFGVRPAGIAEIYPLTGAQETLVATGVACGKVTDFFYVDIDAGLNVSDIERGCLRAFEKFPILRARFLQLQGRFWQVVSHGVGEVFSVQNVEGDLDAYFSNFCLENGKSVQPTQPPAAFFLLLHERRMRLAIRWAHAQYDAFSGPLVFQSIFEENQEIPVKPTFATLLSYAAHQRSQSLTYWSQLLQGSHPTPVLPHVRPMSTNAMPESVHIEVEARLPRRTGKITHATLVRAAWAVLHSRITSETDIIYGQVVAGRNAAIPGVEKIVGCCLNVLPERVDFSSIKTVAELVHAIQDQYLSMGDADSLDFKDIVEHCTEWPAGSGFDTVLHHRNVDEEPLIQTPAGISHMKMVHNPLTPPFIFIVTVSRGENVGIELWANTHITAPEVADTMANNLARIMEKLVTGMHMALPEWMDDVKSFV